MLSIIGAQKRGVVIRCVLHALYAAGELHELFEGRMIDGHRLGECRTCGMVQASPAGESADSSYADYGDYLLLNDDREIRRRVQSTGLAMRSLFELAERLAAEPGSFRDLVGLYYESLRTAAIRRSSNTAETSSPIAA